jgi:hypothetical protein
MNRVRKYLDQKCPKNLSNKRIRLGIVQPQNLYFQTTLDKVALSSFISGKVLDQSLERSVCEYI